MADLREGRIANRHRGEIDAMLDGRRYTLCLTLGALAELEAAFGASDLQALAGRFSEGRLAALDLVRIIGAGLRGAGESVDNSEVAAMQAEGGAAGFARIAADLLTATFGGEAAA
ncbi:Phage tail tube protein, GTA-gp10 [Kaistia soli DSM 19436]|uniref:Phage tail tube protein, GTA-gp10 n=1 Tax=Kaistia soli DSM 19436 TaxID=1122133 RepID=A0A1M4UY81_9HYPH|nr:gene transfer agent family protein [Kaistia soli]SHE61618.1 Phage tail tube protein, GTA-gp10 [Kaistia soli DSM 19436]